MDQDRRGKKSHLNHTSSTCTHIKHTHTSNTHTHSISLNTNTLHTHIHPKHMFSHQIHTHTHTSSLPTHTYKHTLSKLSSSSSHKMPCFTTVTKLTKRMVVCAHKDSSNQSNKHEGGKRERERGEGRREREKTNA